MGACLGLLRSGPGFPFPGRAPAHLVDLPPAASPPRRRPWLTSLWGAYHEDCKGAEPTDLGRGAPVAAKLTSAPAGVQACLAWPRLTSWRN